jgi:hypothetical protein
MDEQQKDVRRLLRRFDIEQSESEYQRMEKRLLKKFDSPASVDDVVWAIVNERLLEATKQKDWSLMQRLYREMARFLYEQRKDFFKPSQEAVRCKLLQYKSGGSFEKVEIRPELDSECCEKCKALAKKQLTIEEALRTMPIPVQDCGSTWCRCTYLPVT